MSKDNSALYRVYQHEGNLLFLKNANSPIGRPMGVIIKTYDDQWEYFPRRADGLTAPHMLRIAEELQTLILEDLHERNVELNAQREAAGPAASDL